MQLAATQRPHPPPVPPRPSRQVVAEALKRSPRPPCPTRQAPPPPNTKPWKAGEQEVSNKSTGRTLVYESGKEASEEKVKEDESKVEKEPKSIIISDSKSRETKKELKIENESKFEAETKTEKELKNEKEPESLARLDSKTQELNVTQKESIETFCPEEEESIKCPLPQSRRPSVESLLENEIYELVEECRLKNLEKGDGTEGPKEIRLGDINLDPSRPRLRSQKMSLAERENAKIKNKDLVDGSRVEKSQKPLVKAPKPQERTNLVRPPVPARNNLVQGKERREFRIRESKGGKSKLGVGAGIEARPAPPLKPRTRIDSSSSNSAMTNDKTGSEINKTILSDDGTTVVVVDEAERKVVAFNEDGDNIHHQDWLEAGVRYSSTQITLSGDEASDRVNGFVHLEDEVEFGDLDFSRYTLREYNLPVTSVKRLSPRDKGERRFKGT